MKEARSSFGAGALVWNLAAQPQFILRYVRYHEAWYRRPIKCALPRWSFAAIDFVRLRLGGGIRVFEYGAGGSTFYFAHWCDSVLAVDHDRQRVDAMVTQARVERWSNLAVCYQPLSGPKAGDYGQSPYVKALKGPQWDVMVIDGQEAAAVAAPACFAQAEACALPGAMVVVNESWRQRGLREGHHARKLMVFEGVGPCRTGVASTDVYMY